MIPAHLLGHGSHDAVSGIGHQAHVHRHGHPYAGTQNCQNQQQEIGKKTVVCTVIGNKCVKQVEHPAEHQTQWELEQIVEVALFSPDGKLGGHKQDVEHKGHIPEVHIQNLGYTVGHRYDGRHPQAGLGVQSEAQGQDHHAQGITAPLVYALRFLERKLGKELPAKLRFASRLLAGGMCRGQSFPRL